MVFLRLPIWVTFLLFVFSFALNAKVSVVCLPEGKCQDIISRFETDEKPEDRITPEFFKALALDKSIGFFKVEVDKENNVLLLVEKKPTIRNVSIEAPDELDEDQILKISQIQEGVFYNREEILEARERLTYWLEERGFLEPVFKVQTEKVSKGDININLKVGFKSKLVLKDISFKNAPNALLTELVVPLKKSMNKPFSKVKFKLLLDNILNELKREGYLGTTIKMNERLEGTSVYVDLDVDLGKRLQFAFYGNKVFDKETLLVTIKKSIEEGTTILRVEDLKAVVQKLYVSKGIYNTKIKLYRRDGKTIDGDEVVSYFFNIDEGKKVKLTKLSFKGNLALDLKDLKEVYYSKGSVLANRDFLDEGYLENFTAILKNFYLRQGYVFVEVSKPRIIFSERNDSAEVTYSIKERQQSVLNKIILDGVPKKYRPSLLDRMVNKVGRPLNVVELESDLSRALDTLRELGFFYATITNLNDDDVVTYESNYTKSNLKLEFKTGKITVLDNVVLSGNKVTKDIVLLREVRLKKGDIVTPERIKGIRDRINGLGLFAKVQVLPVVTNKLSDDEENRTNLIVQVQEKKFGRGEIAPGFRTDIGAKLSFTLSRTNLLGMNDAGTFKLQLNRRFSLSQFDTRRAAERNQKLEGILSLNYRYPYLLNFADFSGSFSIQRRRFFSFDADILRISPQVTKQVNRYLGVSLKYQYEKIRQFDATEEKDRATFEIGSLTPGITLDFRDSPVSPRSGAYFGLNWEFANPYFGSQKDESIEINFSKVISRNRFYVPIGSKNFVFAFSLAAGLQENYADAEAGINTDGSIRTRGYIPSIKVFRLDGFDIVRGYADNEINRLDGGQDITTERVQGKAFFANFKFEPRYYVNDTFVLGPFFDAGRLFIDTFRPSDLRTSTGLTFKFLTPVGTLDFDYGVKLKRERFSDGTRETFGRFHLSIGYF